MRVCVCVCVCVCERRRRRSRRRIFFRIVHARGAIPNEVDQHAVANAGLNQSADETSTAGLVLSFLFD